MESIIQKRKENFVNVLKKEKSVFCLISYVSWGSRLLACYILYADV